jgi:phage baseplate assembly protein W
MSYAAFPYRLTGGGRTAEADLETHIRDLIEQTLFTNPGERVNRPNFGATLSQLAFAPNSPELATATQFLVQGALQQWLGDLIVVQQVSVSADEATLSVEVRYQLRNSQQVRVASFNSGGGP